MLTRRNLGIAAILGVAAAATAGMPGRATATVTEDEALAALDPWIDAIVTGDPARVDAVLAPEFQVLRSNGVGHDKGGYLAALPRQSVRPIFHDIHATVGGDVMVIRYLIETDQIIEGTPVVGTSPRLSVFRRVDGRWLMSAHANFAPLG